MADMPNDFWSGWIVLITAVSFIGLIWLVLSIFFSPQSGVEEDEELVWDGDLREGNTSPPIWWFWMILATMVFSVAYLMLYPGLGSFSGALRWSMGHELQQDQRDYQHRYQDVNEAIMAASIDELQDQPDVMEVGANLFNQNCAACHGYEAQGQASLFPNLRDDEWQWGDSAEQIEASIRHGRKAVMMGWQTALKDEGVEQVSDYILTGFNSADNHPGKKPYNLYCAACHGQQGEGNPLIGASNLADDTWLYGGSAESIRETIANGRNGEMPAYDERLDDMQIKILVAWLKK